MKLYILQNPASTLSYSIAFIFPTCICYRVSEFRTYDLITNI